MSTPAFTYEIFALGDKAITIDLGNYIDKILNDEILYRYHQFKEQPVTGMMEVIPAYSSLTIYYDISAVRKKVQNGNSAFEYIRKEIEKKLAEPVRKIEPEKRLIRIPVCYEHDFAPDLAQLAKDKNINPEEIIKIHTSKTYRVFMMGFLPGFSYMGEVDEIIATPRKAQPVNIVAGSVGIAGRQTGIYPLNSPGGWQIIGRTPVKLFDKENKNGCLLKTGDEIEFFAINQEEFFSLKKDF